VSPPTLVPNPLLVLVQVFNMQMHVNSINLLIDFMSQGNDNEAGGSGGGQ
jgi:hypothetical protein